MSKIEKIILTLLAGLMFGFLAWKLFPFKAIKINFLGFILMLGEIGIFCFSTWKTSGKSHYSLLDKIALLVLIASFVFLLPIYLIGMRISWFFNTLPGFGLLLLACGLAFIFSVSLIHKLLSRFFTNGLWLLDLIHLTAPFWMTAIHPLKISLGADLTLPSLFKWHSTYIYYGVFICYVILGFFLHKKRGEPQSLCLKNKIVPLERISLKVTLAILLGLFVFVSGALLQKYSLHIQDLIQGQSMGLTVVGGYDARIKMAKDFLIVPGVCCLIGIILVIWMCFVKEIAKAHTQISLVLLPLMGISVCLQMVLSLGEKIIPLLMLIRPEIARYLPALKSVNNWLYGLYGLIVFLSFILLRGLLLPKPPKEENTDAFPIEQNNDNSFYNSEKEETETYTDSSLNSMSSDQNVVVQSVPQTRPIPSHTSENTVVNMMMKILVGVIIVLAVLLGVTHYLKSKQPSYNEVVYANTDVKVKYLTGEMLQFVKENYPQESKRLFVYIPEMEDVTCPYMKDFVQGLKQAKLNSKWTSAYHFMPYVNSATGNSRKDVEEKIKQIQKFTETVCGNLCIIDTQENWVFEIKRGDLIPVSLDTFMK